MIQYFWSRMGFSYTGLLKIMIADFDRVMGQEVLYMNFWNEGIHFKSFLQSSILLIVCWKNTFQMILVREKYEPIFLIFFCNVCQTGGSHLFGVGEKLKLFIWPRSISTWNIEAQGAHRSIMPQKQKITPPSGSERNNRPHILSLTRHRTGTWG